MLSCVSCSWPVLFSLTAGAFGSGAAVASAVYEWQYALSLAVFVLTVVLLSWRPFGRDE
jgi:cytochrome c biogenesis protein CcdA